MSELYSTDVPLDSILTDKNRPYYIAVEGPIGVGKTTLVRKLAQHYTARTLLEIVEENPFLSDFYGDREKHAFQTQLFFLLSRYRQQQELWQPDLFKRAIFSDYVFAKDRIFAQLNLSNNERILYDQVYQILDARVLKPDLVIYLHAPLRTLLARIQKRGRPFEKDFDRHYLEKLCEGYDNYFLHYADTPLLVVDTSDINVVDSETDFLDLDRVIFQNRGGVQYYQPTRKKNVSSGLESGTL